jgi:hypothetical protein
MSNPAPASSPALGPVCPEIDASDLKAVRDFLTGFSDQDRRPRPFGRPGDRKAPTVRNGITRARLRSAPKAGD